MQSKPPKIKSIKIIKYIIFGSAALIATILAVVIAFKTLDAVTRQRVMDEAENRIAVFLEQGRKDAISGESPVVPENRIIYSYPSKNPSLFFKSYSIDHGAIIGQTSEEHNYSLLHEVSIEYSEGFKTYYVFQEFASLHYRPGLLNWEEIKDKISWCMDWVSREELYSFLRN